jgi:hypothetical protein
LIEEETMPVYCYQCKTCGKIHTDYRKRVDDRALPGPMCCGAPTTFAPFAATVNSTDMEYNKPVLSESMGVHPSQVAEHRRLHPDIPMTDDGRVIIKSHNEYKRIRKKLGFSDRAGFC